MIRPRSQRHLLVRGGLVVALDAPGRVFAGDVLVTEGRIAELGPGISPPPATRLLEAAGRVVLPGLVQAHVHLGHRLLRGWVRSGPHDPRPLRLSALEQAHDAASARISALLGAAECLLSGSTTVAEFGLPGAWEGVLEGLEEAGIRALAGPVVRADGDDSGTPGTASDPRWDAAVTLLRDLPGKCRGRIRPSVQLETGAVTDARAWTRGAQLARALEAPLHICITGGEGKEVEQFGWTEGQVPFTVLAHGLRLDPGRLEGLSPERTGLVWCPRTEGAGHRAGGEPALLRPPGELPVAIATDGLAGQDGSDLWEVLRQVRSGFGNGNGAVDPRRVLEAATREAARALGLGAELGSLEAGKAGDLIVMDLEGPGGFTPGDVSVYERILAGGGPGSLQWVVVDGEVVVERGGLPHLDEDELRRGPSKEAASLLSRLETLSV